MRKAAVARALVDAEALYLARETEPPLSRLTVSTIVDKYGLDWGEYSSSRGSGTDEEHSYSRAGQLVRIALADAWRDGRLARLRDKYDGKPVKAGKQFVYVCPYLVNVFTVLGRTVELWHYGDTFRSPIATAMPEFLSTMTPDQADAWRQYAASIGVQLP